MINDVSPGRVTVASVADVDDIVLAMIYRHTEPGTPGAPDDTVVISIDGDIDGDAADHLERALHRAIDGGTAVCCDLGRSGYFGSAAARAVLLAVEHAEERGVAFKLRGVGDMPRLVLGVLGVNLSALLSENAEPSGR